MTNTVSFGLERYKFWLEVHNRYSDLENPNVEDILGEHNVQ